MHVVLTVDWEKNAGRWRNRTLAVDYGGVVKGTPVLLDTLGALSVPCTWFVECHRDFPANDLARRFSDDVIGIAHCPMQDVGVHVHFGRLAPAGVSYPVHESAWVEGLLSDAHQALAQLGLAPRAFRAGALLHVPDLAAMLVRCKYSVDSSLAAWSRGVARLPGILEKLRARLRMQFRDTPQPYLCDTHNIYRQGSGPLVEFPVGYSVGSLLRHRWLRHKILCEAERSGHERIVTLYWHIYEIMQPDGDHPMDGQVDAQVLKRLVDLLREFSGAGLKFMHLRVAEDLLLQRLGAVDENTL